VTPTPEAGGISGLLTSRGEVFKHRRSWNISFNRELRGGGCTSNVHPRLRDRYPRVAGARDWQTMVQCGFIWGLYTRLRGPRSAPSSARLNGMARAKSVLINHFCLNRIGACGGSGCCIVTSEK